MYDKVVTEIVDNRILHEKHVKAFAQQEDQKKLDSLPQMATRRETACVTRREKNRRPRSWPAAAGEVRRGEGATLSLPRIFAPLARFGVLYVFSF